MDTNFIVFALVAFSCSIGLFRSLNRPRRNYVWGWIIVYAFVLALDGLTYVISPDNALLFGGLPWLLLMVVPAQCYRLVVRALVQGDYESAYRLAQIARFLHPLDDWWNWGDFIRGYLLAKEGKIKEAAAVFERYQNLNSGIGIDARIEVYRLSGRWEELRRWFEFQPDLRNQPTYAVHYLRALGETGELDEMVKVYGQMRHRLSGSAATALLTIFAFTGQRAIVERILDGTYGAHPPPRNYIGWQWLISPQGGLNLLVMKCSA